MVLCGCPGGRKGKALASTTRTPSTPKTLASLSMTSIVVQAEDRFSVTIPDEDTKNLKTVRDVVNYIQQAQG